MRHSAGAWELTWLLTHAVAVAIFAKICRVETTRIFGHCSVLSLPDNVNLIYRLDEICSEMHAYEIHELDDRHHKVSPNLNSY